MEQFLQRCFYQSGQYGSEENFVELDQKLREKEVLLFPENSEFNNKLCGDGCCVLLIPVYPI